MARHRYGIIGGSWSLKLRGLLHRKTKDIDICGIPYDKNLYKFCKRLCIKLDFCNPNLYRFDEINYKNYKVRIAKLEDVLFYKYRIQRKIDSDPHMIGIKHYKDIVNVFHNLGEKGSKKLIEEIHLPIEDKNILTEGMYIGLNNTTEI